MKKLFFILVLVAFTLISCDKNEVTELQQQTDLNRLEFKSKDEVIAAIEALDNGDDCDVLLKNPNFVNYMKANEMIRKNGMQKVDGISTDEFTLALDTLVPNKSFAALLNSNGEIVLNDTIFKITPNGTYKYPKNKELIFNRLFDADSLLMGTLISENFYKITDGIYRYDSFKDEIIQVLDEPTNESINITGISKVSNASSGEPNFNSFPTYNADRHTFFGKIVQSLIGGTKTYDVDFKENSDKRLKGKFYFYNYGIYAESGVTGTTQRKRWIGWSDTEADELRMGWKGVVLEMDLPKPIPIPNNQPIVMSNPFEQSLPGNRELGKTVNLVLYDVPTDLLLRAAKYGFDELCRQLKSLNNKPAAKPAAVNVISPTKIYTIIFNENKKGYNIEKLNHVFSSQFKFKISINAMDFPSNAVQWANAFKGTLDLPYPKMKYGEIYTCAKFGTEWKGMKIVKSMD